MRLLIRNGTVVSAEASRAADVLVDGETIAEVRPGISAAADRTLDAAGRYVLPGGVDVHTHLDMPYGDAVSADDFASGTIAAALGGTTTIVDFAVQDRGGTLQGAVETWQAKARGKAVIDYGFHVIVTDVTPGVLGEMDEGVADGVTTFKLFMAYPGRLMVDDAAIFRVLLTTARNGGMVMMHAENGGVIEVLEERALAAGHIEPMQHALTRPPLVEAEAAHRAITLAELAGAPVYVVHVSAEETADVIAGARSRGLPVYGETCPQYLFLTNAAYEDDGARFIMSPPLRDQRAQERLWRALLEGDLQAGAPDHCPFTLADKRRHAEFTKVPGRPPPPARAPGGRGGDGAGADLRAVSAEGDDRAGLRRRPGDLGSTAHAHDQRGDAPHARGLQPVRRAPGEGRARHCAAARPAHRRTRRLCGRGGVGPVPASRAAVLTRGDARPAPHRGAGAAD